MGRPILYIPGIQDMDDVQTLAALTILGRVAEHVATYDIKIRMPVSRSLVMTAARETIKASYQAAGRPDAYNEDMVSYVTDEQFDVAAVSGIMVRERPATVFLLGAFLASRLFCRNGQLGQRDQMPAPPVGPDPVLCRIAISR
jgi:hypothetical protein